jgi:hypothetical protein
MGMMMIIIIIIMRIYRKARERERPLGRPRYKWVDNIGMDLGEIVCGGVDQIGLAQDREK